MSLAQVAAVVGVSVAVAAAVWGLVFSRRDYFFASDDPGVVPDNPRRASTVRLWRFDDSIKDGARLASTSPVRPAVLGLLRRSLIKPRDMAVMVVDLAVRGHVKIDEVSTGSGTDWALLWRNESSSNGGLQGYEKKFLEAVFTDSNTVLVRNLRRGFGPKFIEVQNALYAGSVKSGLFKANPIDEVIGFRKFGAMGIVGSIFLLGLLITDEGGWVYVALPVLAGAFALMGFSTRAARRTALGSALHIQGQRLLTFMQDGDIDGESFEELLPFAVAGGFTTGWGSRCDAADSGGPSDATGVADAAKLSWLDSPRVGAGASCGEVASVVEGFASSFEKMVRDSRKGNKR